MEKSKYIWLNGEFVVWDDAKTHVLDHGLHYGTGVFEGIRTYELSNGNSAIFKLEEHVQRLFRSARALKMEIPYKPEEVEEVIVTTVRKNELKECYIRPLVWYGFKELGLRAQGLPTNIMIAVWKWGKYLGAEGIKARISTWTRNHPNSFPNEAKIVGGYVNSFLASIEARTSGYDEAILLDHRGFISEGPGENIFLVEKGKLLTPPLHASSLPGITRDVVMILAYDLGYAVIETDITKGRLYNCEEAFFTGTAAEITPIYEVDDRKIGIGTIGSITKRIRDLFYEVVKGERSEYTNWLTPVYK
jgi:branched-chain amino acid aminotransferase